MLSINVDVNQITHLVHVVWEVIVVVSTYDRMIITTIEYDGGSSLTSELLCYVRNSNNKIKHIIKKYIYGE